MSRRGIRLARAASAAALAAALSIPSAWPAPEAPAPPAAPSSLTLDEAIRLAVGASPALRAARERVAVEEGLRHQAGLYPNPDLSLDATWFTDTWNYREAILTLRQPIPWHGKRGLMQHEADERIAAARADAESARLDLFLKVRESFYRIIWSGTILDLDRENLEAARAIHTAVEARVAAGDAAPFEALKAAVEVSRAESEVRQVEGERQAETAVFNLLLGLPASAATTVAAATSFAAPVDLAPIGQNAPEADLPDLLTRALRTQPEIQARAHAALAAGAAADLARLDPRPDIGVGPSFGTDQGEAMVGVGLSLKLPVWDRNQGRIAAADAGRRQAEAEVDAARLLVSSSVADAYGRFRSASDLRRLYQEGLLAQADSLVELARKSYDGGATGILDLLDARRTAILVKEDYYRACLDAALAAARLRRAVGEEDAP